VTDIDHTIKLKFMHLKLFNLCNCCTYFSIEFSNLTYESLLIKNCAICSSLCCDTGCSEKKLRADKSQGILAVIRRRIFVFHLLSKNIKIKIYRTEILSVVVLGVKLGRSQ
jgi:hypothetical protein